MLRSIDLRSIKS